MERERRTDKTWCHQKYMYEEWKEHKNVYIDSIRKLANKKLSLSHSSCIHIKNILKTQDKTATIAIAAFIHVYIYIHTISMFLFSGHDARLLEWERAR